jgi:hypothetical protein
MDISHNTFNRYIDLSQEDITTTMPQDGMYEEIECLTCYGEGCKDCNGTGYEQPDM